MKILLASSEATPFAQSGGLAEVCAALPRALARLDQQVAVILPAYRQVRQAGVRLESLGIEFDVPIGAKIMRGALLGSHLPGSQVPVYLVQQDYYFNRPELYTERGRDYIDNCERFVFFSRAVLEAVRLLSLAPQLIHCHDWHTGLIPALLELEYNHTAGYEQIATLFTAHNLAYQGRFWHWDMLLTGLDWKYFNWRQMEAYGELNLLKTGLVFADAISTMSPQYAREIQTPEFGHGLEGVLQDRRGILTGVLGGIETDVWNPATDPLLAARYDVTNWRAGKAQCKAALQQALGLPAAPRTPLVGVVGRLDDQKGAPILLEVLGRWAAERDVQWVVLGQGPRQYEGRLQALAREFPSRLAVRLERSEVLAHRIYAGADLIAIPSRFEPGGFGQLQALRYGAVPVVRRTGGLADTITDASGAELAGGMANGFVFVDFTAAACEAALSRACDMFREQPAAWARLVDAGMRQDWSWAKSARQYIRLYEQAVERRLRELAPSNPLA